MIDIRRGVKENSSVILTVAAGAGTIGPAYLAALAGYKTAQKLGEEAPYDDLRTKAWSVWRFYIPAAASGTFTIICIVSVKRVGGQKTLAAQTALAATQYAYSAYRDEVISELGEKTDQKVLARVAERQVHAAPPPALVIGTGSVLCCELFTGRYFQSDAQELYKAVNDLNAKLLAHDMATLDDFYELIGLEQTMGSGQAGWTSEKGLLKLDISAIMHDGRPCLAFAYNYVKSF